MPRRMYDLVARKAGAIRCKLLLLGAVAIMLSGISASAAVTDALQIYFIDVEGGQSTLIVTPAREVLLVDAGFAGEGGFSSEPGDPAKARDPNRILAAMRDAGVARIDYLMVTHFHRDHIGGIPEIAQLVPVGTFIDHGSAYPPQQRAKPESLDLLDVAAYDRYVQVRTQGKHLLPKPGDRLPLKGVDTTVVSADRAILRQPLSGAGGPNPVCRPSPLTPLDPLDENPRSNGIVLQFGKFRFLDIGDLNSQPLYDLVCPVDRIGPVDVYLVAHHGNSTVADPATLAVFRPRVAVVNNAPRKGGRLALLQMLRRTPGLESWQLHVSSEATENNAPPERIANLDETSAYWLKVAARADGSFTVTNGRTGISSDYGIRP
ncbi:MAG: MBL fold metallo-hydrolase [Pseudomonadota bacterium]